LNMILILEELFSQARGAGGMEVAPDRGEGLQLYLELEVEHMVVDHMVEDKQKAVGHMVVDHKVDNLELVVGHMEDNFVLVVHREDILVVVEVVAHKEDNLVLFGHMYLIVDHKHLIAVHKYLAVRKY